MKNEICIPIDIFDGRFSLEEIAAIGVLMSIHYIPVKNKNKWLNDPHLQKVVDTFLENGVVKITEDKTIEIDIEKQTKIKEKMTIQSALKELKETWGYETEELNHIRELMEELASESYRVGYEDANIDTISSSDVYTGYGKKEDY